MKTDMTVIILTKNEELNIERCINSVNNWVARIVVVDSGSTDKTVELAEKLGAEIYHHAPFIDYAKQFNWAIDNIGIKTNWVFRLDADEVVTNNAREEIITMLEKHSSDDVCGFMMRYKVYFLGKFLKHGDAYPFLKITIFKYGKGRFEDRSMGEHIVLNEGRCIDLKQDCLHYDFKDLNTYINKHNRYATREVMDHFDVVNGKQNAKLDGRPEKDKKLRDSVYYKMPKFLRAKFFYWYRYYLRFGFLDGTQGMIYAFIQAYWYRFIIDAKIYEKELEQNNRTSTIQGGGKCLINNHIGCAPYVLSAA